MALNRISVQTSSVEGLVNSVTSVLPTFGVVEMNTVYSNPPAPAGILGRWRVRRDYEKQFNYQTGGRS